jgi:hypothetical protein
VGKLLFLALACCAWAQNDRTVYTTDINGNRMASASFAASESSKTEKSQSVNGRTVPLEQSETHILSKSGNRTVTETVIKRFDPTGQVAITERVVTDTTKQPNGSSTISIQKFQSDLNGSMSETERQQVQTTVNGNNTASETVVSRPTLNGSFQATEKRSSKTETAGEHSSSTETVYRLSPNGEMFTALQRVKTQVKQGNTATEQVAEYEPGVTGTLQLARQTVSSSTKDAAGNETTETNLYSAAADGRVQESGASQQIKEQQIITRKAGSNGTVTETLAVRRPSLADPNRLGSAQTISETVCKGNCKP